MPEKKSFWREGFLPYMKNIIKDLSGFGKTIIPFIISAYIGLGIASTYFQGNTKMQVYVSFASMLIGFFATLTWMSYLDWKTAQTM